MPLCRQAGEAVPGSFRFTFLSGFLKFRCPVTRRPALQFPLDRPGPYTDRVEMVVSPAHGDPFKSLAMGTDSPFHDMRDQEKRDVPLDHCRPPGHQDLFLRMIILSRQSRNPIAFAIQERSGILPRGLNREKMKVLFFPLFPMPAFKQAVTSSLLQQPHRLS